MNCSTNNQIRQYPCVDKLSPNARLPTSANQQSDGRGTTANKEIQDFESPSEFESHSKQSESPSEHLPSSIPSIGSNQNVLTVPQDLYQLTPRRLNSFYRVMNRMSWVDSRETYQNAARREYHLLITNPRQGNHFVTLKYFRTFSALEVRTTWSKLKALLKQHVVGYAVVEITTRSYVLPDGRRWNSPINRIHYHILVDSDLSERQLRNVFNSSCLEVGLERKEFEVQYEAIPDRRTFEHKAKYILKFDNFSDQAVLFQPGTGINKVCSIGRWFINADGSRANKDLMWKSIVAGWYGQK
jgi:hypothetical protein